MECWIAGTQHSNYSITPTFPAQLSHQRLRIHHHAKVLVEVIERRVLLCLREGSVTVRQKQHFEIAHGAVARRAVAADVGRHAGDRDGVAPHGAQKILQLRAVKAAVAKFFNQNIVRRRLYRLVDFRARTAFEVAPFVVGVMGLRLDIGEDTDIGQVFALGRVQIDHRHFARRGRKRSSLLNLRHDIFGRRQVARAARVHPDILHVDDDERGIVRRNRPTIGGPALSRCHISSKKASSEFAVKTISPPR